jgi:hypothetical protein
VFAKLPRGILPPIPKAIKIPLTLPEGGFSPNEAGAIKKKIINKYFNVRIIVK